MQGKVQNYATLSKRVNLQHEKKLLSSLKSMQSKAFRDFHFIRIISLLESKPYWKLAQRQSLILPVCIVLTNYLKYDPLRVI